MTEHGNDIVQVQQGFVNDKHVREEYMFILYVHCEKYSPPSVPRLSAARSAQPADQDGLTAGYYLWQLFQLGRHLQIKITVICVV